MIHMRVTLRITPEMNRSLHPRSHIRNMRLQAKGSTMELKVRYPLNSASVINSQENRETNMGLRALAEYWMIAARVGRLCGLESRGRGGRGEEKGKGDGDKKCR